MLKNVEHGVEIWEQDIVIPTYLVGEPDKNPMFLEKRVYQGSSGKVYPHSVIDRISDKKTDVTYRAVFLENRYLHIMILPELGGRIQRALDKTNQYDFVYYNHVIKPALAGFEQYIDQGGELQDLLSHVNHPSLGGHKMIATALSRWFLAR